MQQQHLPTSSRLLSRTKTNESDDARVRLPTHDGDLPEVFVERAPPQTQALDARENILSLEPWIPFEDGGYVVPPFACLRSRRSVTARYTASMGLASEPGELV